ncbi:MAG: DUF305 domain-containing protein [Balneolaceae bacterium]|nr:DUF305 domain-containing protein [Balneolaceae bacterium]MBO6547691.1 DUF305 domain-containing protein [Balneolaceae bacterium]MBO6648202.1 DUF305 domain-containing protein [Balneolaceae bacterium]
MKVKTTRIFVFAVIGIFTFACKNTQTTTTQTGSSQSSDERTSSASTEELEELYWARIDSSRMNFTQADVDFMTNMIGHHAQALIMSDLAPKNNASPEIQILAARIINAQKDEIATMQTWLRDRDQPVPEVHINGLMLMIHGVGDHHDHMNMQGMLTQGQLVELSEAKGEEFDRLFLTYMIEHHQGAVSMVKTLIATDGAVQDEGAFRLATDINVDQITEIERMKLMLRNMSLNEF